MLLKLLAFKLLIDVVLPFTNPNMVVDVAFKLLMDKIEPVDNELILVNNVVEVAFKLLIDKIELVDNEIILDKNVVEVAFKLLLMLYDHSLILIWWLRLHLNYWWIK